MLTDFNNNNLINNQLKKPICKIVNTSEVILFFRKDLL